MNNNNNDNNLEKLFKLLKELSENGADVSVVNLSGHPFSTDDIASRKKKQDSANEPSPEFVDFLKSIQDQFEGTLGDEEEEEDDEKDEKLPFDLEDVLSHINNIQKNKTRLQSALEDMTDQEKISSIAYATMDALQDLDINHDLFLCELLGIAAMSTFIGMAKEQRIGLKTLKGDAKSIIELFQDEKATFKDTALEKAITLGKNIHETLNKPSANLSDREIVIVLAYALNLGLRS